MPALRMVRKCLRRKNVCESERNRICERAIDHGSFWSTDSTTSFRFLAISNRFVRKKYLLFDTVLCTPRFSTTRPQKEVDYKSPQIIEAPISIPSNPSIMVTLVRISLVVLMAAGLHSVSCADTTGAPVLPTPEQPGMVTSSATNQPLFSLPVELFPLREYLSSYEFGRGPLAEINREAFQRRQEVFATPLYTSPYTPLYPTSTTTESGQTANFRSFLSKRELLSGLAISNTAEWRVQEPSGRPRKLLMEKVREAAAYARRPLLDDTAAASVSRGVVDTLPLLEEQKHREDITDLFMRVAESDYEGSASPLLVAMVKEMVMTVWADPHVSIEWGPLIQREQILSIEVRGGLLFYKMVLCGNIITG